MPQPRRPCDKRRPLSDQFILYLFQIGHYRAVGSTILNRKGKALRRYKDDHYRKTPYLFVEIHYRGARKKIALHKLLWMVHHNQTVPPGCELHHTHSKEHVEPEFIKLLTVEEHLALTLAARQEALDDFLSH